MYALKRFTRFEYTKGTRVYTLNFLLQCSLIYITIRLLVTHAFRSLTRVHVIHFFIVLTCLFRTFFPQTVIRVVYASGL
jgi:hypothetical protein